MGGKKKRNGDLPIKKAVPAVSEGAGHTQEKKTRRL